MNAKIVPVLLGAAVIFMCMVGAAAPAVVTVPDELPPYSAAPVARTAVQTPDLSFPQTFAITRPTEKITTAYATYFITGTSDPAQPVYFGDTEIERQGTKGLFGVLVTLNNGANTFKFSQGDQSATVTITRKAAVTAAISAIPQSSMYPAYCGSGRAGGELLAECTAPSGASVSATFAGATIPLTQVDKAGAGQPAVFRAVFTLAEGYTADETTNAGKITYTLNYGGVKKDFTSTGDVFIAGKDAPLVVQVSGYLGLVYPDPTVLSVYKEKIKQNTVDYVLSQDNMSYKLASGGYLPTSMGRILAGKNSIRSQLTGVSFAGEAKNETYTFHGANNAMFVTSIGEGTFSITLYNTTGTPDVSVSSSRLFAGAEAAELEGGGVMYTFTQKSTGNLWGYNVSHNGSDTVLRFAYKPSKSDSGQPLSGISIVLDPGHGGDDPGASGVPGKSGPNENVLNLAYALALKEKLEAQGAEVLMTRSTTDGFLELDERLQFFEQSGADLFVSLHHNSMAESADANKTRGMEVYYHSPLSRNFANKMIQFVAPGMGRELLKVVQSYYRVTILPFAPSILFELGYLSNPLEYEKITNTAELEKMAVQMTEAILTVFG